MLRLLILLLLTPICLKAQDSIMVYFPKIKNMNYDAKQAALVNVTSEKIIVGNPKGRHLYIYEKSFNSNETMINKHKCRLSYRQKDLSGDLDLFYHDGTFGFINTGSNGLEILDNNYNIIHTVKINPAIYGTVVKLDSSYLLLETYVGDEAGESIQYLNIQIHNNTVLAKAGSLIIPSTAIIFSISPMQLFSKGPENTLLINDFFNGIIYRYNSSCQLIGKDTFNLPRWDNHAYLDTFKAITSNTKRALSYVMYKIIPKGPFYNGFSYNNDTALFFCSYTNSFYLFRYSTEEILQLPEWLKNPVYPSICYRNTPGKPVIVSFVEENKQKNQPFAEESMVLIIKQ